MAHNVFISHVEEDSGIAIELAQGLEQASITTWYYERDSVPGSPYLLQVSTAIETADIVAVIISPASLGSLQVTNEVVRAYEDGKPFVPLLVGISHTEFQVRRPEWRQALGASTSIAVPASGVSEILKRVVGGIHDLIDRRETTPSQQIRGNLLRRPESRGARSPMPARINSSPVSQTGRVRPLGRKAWAFLIATALIALAAIGIWTVRRQTTTVGLVSAPTQYDAKTPPTEISFIGPADLARLRGTVAPVKVSRKLGTDEDNVEPDDSEQTPSTPAQFAYYLKGLPEDSEDELGQELRELHLSDSALGEILYSRSGTDVRYDYTDKNGITNIVARCGYANRELNGGMVSDIDSLFYFKPYAAFTFVNPSSSPTVITSCKVNVAAATASAPLLALGETVIDLELGVDNYGLRPNMQPTETYMLPNGWTAPMHLYSIGGNIDSAILRFTVSRPTDQLDAAFQRPTFDVRIPIAGSSTDFDLAKYLKTVWRLDKTNEPPNGVAAFVVGTIACEYRGRVYKPFRFIHIVRTERPRSSMEQDLGPAIAGTIYPLKVSPTDAGKTLDLAVSREIKPEGTDRFLVRFDSTTSASYDFEFTFFGSAPIMVNQDRVHLEAMSPGYHSGDYDVAP